jgi:hypothetical protein
MKLLASIVETAVEQMVVAPPSLNQPTPALEEQPSYNFTYRELKKAASEMVTLTAFNLNTIFKNQAPLFEEANFIDFHLGANSLVAKYNVIFSDRSQGCVFVGWDGNKLRAF